MSEKAMLPNAGGEIAPENLIGRDELIEKMWSLLGHQCIYMNDLRRIGKTQILNKMAASPPMGWLVIKRDLEEFHSAAEFATGVFRDAAKVLGVAQTAVRTMGHMFKMFGELEIGALGLKIKGPGDKEAPWKDVLTKTIDDVEESAFARGIKIVFLWDELPFLIQGISANEGPEVAMQLLDVLRAKSQSCKRVRFVFTGSIGLHHVLAALKVKGYAGSPINHMKRISPGPLTKEYAIQLSESLIIGADLECQDPRKAAQTVAKLTDCVPFFIQKLIESWPPERSIESHSIATVIDEQITKPDSDWDLEHYQTRIPLHYGENSDLVLHILDAIASSSKALGLVGIRNYVSAKSPITEADNERILAQLGLLEKDQYLTQNPKTKAYSFRFTLIQRWWKIKRSL